jgi:hypothetical protein
MSEESVALISHAAFAVEDIDAVVAGLRARGAELVGQLERYEDSYRLCYVRGPEGNHHRASGANRLRARVANPRAALAVADRLVRHDERADAADERERREGGGSRLRRG